MHDLEKQRTLNHTALPGIVRATLVDYGISEQVIDRRLVGWDGKHVTIPVHDTENRIVFFERWDASAIGEPSGRAPFVELYPWSTVSGRHDRLLITEGIHEALVLESQGFPTITATGSGRFFKQRDWAASVAAVPQVVLAYRRGEKLERRRFLHSRSELAAKVQRAIPHASVLEWPKAVGRNGGAYEFFVTLRKTKDEFEALLSQAA